MKNLPCFRSEAFINCMRVPALCFIIGLIVSACSPHENKTASSPPASTLIRLMDAEIKSLDPQKASDLSSLRVATDIFEGLTRFNGQGNVEPGLASSWSTSTNGLEWRMTIRKGLRFSDNTPINAGTFVRVFERLRAESTASPNASLFDVIKEIKAAEPETLDIVLKQPFPSLPELLAHPALSALPMHHITRAGEEWTKARPLTASGPYQLHQWILHDRIVLKHNSAWHDDAPAALQVEWRPVDDRQAAFRRFRAGEAHLASDFPSGQFAWMQKNLPGQARVTPYRGVYYFAFNTRRPPFNDKRVRQALHLTVEREQIAAKLMLPGTPPAWGIIPPDIDGTSETFRPDWSYLQRSVRIYQANKLLAKAGYTTDHPLKFEIRFNSDNDHRRIALALLDNWKSLPIKVRLLNTEATLHFASLRNGDFDLARSGWIGDLSAPENYLSVHKSNAGPVNYSGFSNNAFDSALERASKIAEPRLRAQAMRQAEAILMDEAPILPVYYYVSKNLLSPVIEGWHDNPANVHPSRSLSFKIP